MFSIDTGILRQQAEMLEKEAARYIWRISQTESCRQWLKRQESTEMEQLYRILGQEKERLELQRRKLLRMAEALWQICESYDRTEQALEEKGTVFRLRPIRVEWIDLKNLKERISNLGIRLWE